MGKTSAEYEYSWPEDLPEDVAVSPFDAHDVCVPFPRGNEGETVGYTHVWPPYFIDEETGEKVYEFEDTITVHCDKCGVELTDDVTYQVMTWEPYGGQIFDLAWACESCAPYVQNRLRRELRAWWTWVSLTWRQMREKHPDEFSSQIWGRVQKSLFAMHRIRDDAKSEKYSSV